MLKLIKTIKLYYKIGYVILNCVKHSWRIEIITRSKKIVNKVIIRIDDTDYEYLCMKYNLDYKPICLEDGPSFKLVMRKVYNKIRSFLND